MASPDFAHILWKASKPIIFSTNNKSVTRFFQTKAIPPSLWNACEYVLQFNFKIAHIGGLVDTAPDFLSRLEMKVTEKIHLKTGRMYKQHPWGENIFLRCFAWKTIFLHATRRSKWNWKTDLATERTISEKSSRMGNISGTNLNEAKYQRIHKTRRKHYVVSHQENRSNCTNTSRVRCWSSIEESKTQNTWPTTWWCALDNRQTIWALQSKRGSHYPKRWTLIPEMLQRNW